MKFRSYDREMIDLRTALWVAFLLFVLTIGEPDLIDSLIGMVGRMP